LKITLKKTKLRKFKMKPFTALFWGIFCLAINAQAAFKKTTDLTLMQSNKYEDILSVANDKTIEYETRWKAVMQLADSSPTRAITDLKEFLSGKEWFIRSAAMTALNEINPSEGKSAALKLLSDRALVVRSAAVQVLESHIDTQVRSRLWQEMAASYNFRKKQSLWVRGQILSLLSQKPLPSEKKQFENLKSDSDKRVSAVASGVILK
jgi:HEAT repeat protein